LRSAALLAEVGERLTGGDTTGDEHRAAGRALLAIDRADQEAGL
jgi:hypothetical protein